MFQKFLIVIILFILPILGCGKSDITAPSESTITIEPSSGVTATIAGDTTYVFYVSVKDKDGNAMNNVQVVINGSFASPRTPTRYQFYKEVSAATPVDSGFAGVTDEFGVYGFSIIVPATVGGSTNSFTDNIEVSSGTSFKSVAISINE